MTFYGILNVDAKQIRFDTSFEGHDEVVSSSNILIKIIPDVIISHICKNTDNILITVQLVSFTLVQYAQYVSSRSFLPGTAMICL